MIDVWVLQVISALSNASDLLKADLMPAIAYTPPYARMNATRLTLKVGSVTMPYPAYETLVSCQNGHQ